MMAIERFKGYLGKNKPKKWEKETKKWEKETKIWEKKVTKKGGKDGNQKNGKKFGKRKQGTKKMGKKKEKNGKKRKPKNGKNIGKKKYCASWGLGQGKSVLYCDGGHDVGTVDVTFAEVGKGKGYLEEREEGFHVSHGTEVIMDRDDYEVDCNEIWLILFQVTENIQERTVSLFEVCQKLESHG